MGVHFIRITSAREGKGRANLSNVFRRAQETEFCIMIRIRDSYCGVIRFAKRRSFLRLTLFSLLPARISVKFINSFSGMFHGAKDWDGSGEELLLYLQSFWLSGARR